MTQSGVLEQGAVFRRERSGELESQTGRIWPTDGRARQGYGKPGRRAHASVPTTPCTHHPADVRRHSDRRRTPLPGYFLPQFLKQDPPGLWWPTRRM